MNISEILFDNAKAVNWTLTEIIDIPSKWLHYLNSKKKRIRKKYQDRIDNIPRKTISGEFENSYKPEENSSQIIGLNPKDFYIGVSLTPLNFDTSDIVEPNFYSGYKREKI